MPFLKPVLFALLIVISSVACECSFLTNVSQHRGAVIERQQVQNKTFEVRVTSYEEKGAAVNGAYYVFESAMLESNDWHEIVTFRHDDRPKVPVEQVRFVNDQVAYLFMGWVCAVTIDGGITWSVWDAKRDLPDWQCCNYGLIRGVNIADTGRGTMRLNPIQDRRGEVLELRTDDYGKHWRR